LDNLLFVGTGSTSAVHKLINILRITEQTLILVSPYEHHSNLLPWRETGSEIIYANDGLKTSIDLIDLENKLKYYQNDRRLKIATFTVFIIDYLIIL
jgi:selenocysteine lyase/cysteine desulfurase